MEQTINTEAMSVNGEVFIDLIRTDFEKLEELESNITSAKALSYIAEDEPEKKYTVMLELSMEVVYDDIEAIDEDKAIEYARRELERQLSHVPYTTCNVEGWDIVE
jgi:hypothetical protein